MNWQQLYNALLDGETVKVKFSDAKQKSSCRAILSRMRKEGYATLVLLDMDETKLEIKRLDDEGTHSIRFAPKEQRSVPFQIVED